MYHHGILSLASFWFSLEGILLFQMNPNHLFVFDLDFPLFLPVVDSHIWGWIVWATRRKEKKKKQKLLSCGDPGINTYIGRGLGHLSLRRSKEKIKKEKAFVMPTVWTFMHTYANFLRHSFFY